MQSDWELRGGVCAFKSYVARNIEKKPARLVEAGVLVRVHVQRTVRVRVHQHICQGDAELGARLTQEHRRTM